MAWFNPDGLHLKFGTEKTVPNKAGEYRTVGALREIEVRIDLATLVATPTILSDQTFFPKGARVEEVEVVVHTAATGATATLNLGLIRLDRTTVYDPDGFLAAFPLASMDAAGEKTVVRIGSAGAGSLIGTTTANAGYLVADFDTAAFTTGVIFVRIRYYTA
jgi:hypothetical protein